MRAHVLSIGSELILGHLTDTNATYLAQELAALGVELVHVTQVGDDRARIAATIRAALAGAELVVCTGGVGPTEDDLTREAIADVLGQTPTVDEGLLAGIRAFFAARGLTMPERNAKQAWLIPAAEPLPNPVGTAPGWFVRADRGVVVAMPGVPREMYRMWREQVVPRITPLLPARVVRSLTFKTLGIGESAVEELIHDLVAREHPVVATYAKDDGVHVRVTVTAPTEPEATGALAAAAADVRARLADYIYADDDTPLATALLERARGRGVSLAIAEFGTGGRFAGLLLSDPDAGATVVGGEVRPERLGSVRSAESAAEAIRRRLGADCGVALVAELRRREGSLVDGSVDVAVAGSVAARQSFSLRSAFVEVQRRAALHAADVLRRALGDPAPPR